MRRDCKEKEKTIQNNKSIKNKLGPEMRRQDDLLRGRTGQGCLGAGLGGMGAPEGGSCGCLF
jgi:hypothetical protein